MESIRKIKAHLKSLRKIDLGYPQGTNVVFAPALREEVLRGLRALNLEDSSLREFYSECDGLSLPDVQNGYFINRVAQFARNWERSDWVRRVDGFGEEFITIGSMGGGELFVLGLESGHTFVLPGGLIEESIYHGPVVPLGGGLTSLMDRIASDFGAFIAGDAEHEFLG